MEDVTDLLRRSGDVNLPAEAEVLAKRLYSSDALDRLSGTSLGLFMDAMVELKADPVAMHRGFHVMTLIASKHRKFGAKFLSYVGTSELVNIMLLHRQSSLAQSKCTLFLNVLALDDDCRALLVDAGAASALVAVMSALAKDAETVGRSCVALTNLSRVDHARKVAMGGQGAVRALYLAANNLKTNPSIVMAVLVSIRNLTMECPENVALCRQEGVSEIIFELSTKYKTNFNVQMQVIVVLTHILQYDNELRAEVAHDAARLGAIIGLLRASIRAEGLAENAAACGRTLQLLRLIVDKNEQSSVLVTQLGLIGTMRKGFEVFSASPKYVESACAVLRALGFYSLPRELMRTSNIFENVVKALEDFASNPGVVEQSLCVICNACVENKGNQETLGMLSAVESTVHAMELHRENPVLQDYGCRALRNLADNSELNVRLEGELGGINATTLAMLGFPKDYDLAEQACAALLNMARSEQNAARMVEEHGVPQIVSRAVSTSEHEGFKKLASRLLNLLEKRFQQEQSSARSETAFTKGLRIPQPAGLQRSRSGGAVTQRDISRRVSRMRDKTVSRQGGSVAPPTPTREAEVEGMGRFRRAMALKK